MFHKIALKRVIQTGLYQNVFSFTRHLLNTHTRTYARTHAHTHAHIHIHAHTRTRTHSHTHVYGMFYFLLVPDKIEQRLQWFLFLWCSCPVDRATLCTRTDHKHKYDTQDDSGKRGGQVVHDGSQTNTSYKSVRKYTINEFNNLSSIYTIILYIYEFAD